MKKSKKWITFSVCAATLSLFLATNNFADETQTTHTTTSSTVTVSSSSSAPVTESTETTATTTTTSQGNTENHEGEIATQTAVQEIKPIEGIIKNVNQDNGTYDIIVKVNAEIKSGIKKVEVPIWQRADQKDLKWYQAEKQNDGTWLVHMNIANHKYHRGAYTTHVYVRANDGSFEAINIGQTELKPIASQLSADITNVDSENGSFDVVVRGISGSGIHHVKVPIWSTPNQSDLKWYDAVKQADGSYIAHMDIKNHQYHTGKYTVHVYMYNNDRTGLAKNIGQVSIKGINDVLDAKVQNVNIDAGSYDVVVKASSMSGISKVQVPIWSAKDQNDLKWYDAFKQTDGSYIVHMNIRNHKYHRGEYTTHIYMTANDGHQKAINIGKTELPDINNQLKAEIRNVNQEQGTYDVVVKGQIDSGIKKIQVPIWSAKDQNDLKWYDAQRQADGSYIVHMNIKNHKHHRGVYTTHIYMTANSGKQKAINIGTTNLPDMYTKLEGTITNINKEQGTYDVVIKGQIDSGIKKIQVPIWSTKDQNDIKWYDAQKQADGSYIVHMNIKNHKFNTGTYNTHIYMTSNVGKTKAIALSKTNVEAKAIKEAISADIVNINQIKGTFDVFVYTFSRNTVKKVQVPIWHKADQSDIKWYPATWINDYTYKVSFDVKNHNYANGDYQIHAYSTSPDGKTIFINAGTVKLTGNYVSRKANYLGTSREKIVNELNKHRYDRYYLGTPFSGLRSNNASLYMRPGIAMNCTGFVATVVRNASGDLSKITRLSNRWGGVANAYNWRDALTKTVRYYTFNSVSDLLRSRKVQKGDIIYFDPNYSLPNYDCHIGIYWGDYPGHNQIWHQMEINKISHIYSGSPYSKVYLFSMGTE
ncbi:GBS Bsp-like repeat-containing protein [Enterococcus cecorum]|uniref:GBS Bsp-like repeat-containing protein n=1 Tax=Enterococcus cecorum TaxID=44008 RepID=UPI003F92B72A